MPGIPESSFVRGSPPAIAEAVVSPRRFCRRAPGRGSLPTAAIAVGLLLGAVGCGGARQEAIVTATPVGGPCPTPTATSCPPPSPEPPPPASPIAAGSPAASPSLASAPATPTPSSAGPPRVPTPSGSPTVYRSGAAEIGPVVWASAIDPQTKEPQDRVEVFTPGTRTIYATLPLSTLAPGTDLRATWSYNGTPLDGFLSSLTTDREARDIWVEFHIALTGDESWPTGTYAIEVRVNGELAQAAAVRVAEDGDS